jgi:hypothetical protein
LGKTLLTTSLEVSPEEGVKAVMPAGIAAMLSIRTLAASYSMLTD